MIPRSLCLRVGRFAACISPMLLAATVLFAAIYALLYRYPSGVNHRIDIAVAVVITLSTLVLIGHMFWDRALRLWNAAATGILYFLCCVLALFSFFLWQFAQGRLAPGAQEAWLDVCRATGFVAAPFALTAVILHHLREWKSGNRHGGSDDLLGTSLMSTERERRANTEDRRAAVRERMTRLAELEARVAEFEGR